MRGLRGTLWMALVYSFIIQSDLLLSRLLITRTLHAISSPALGLCHRHSIDLEQLDFELESAMKSSAQKRSTQL